MNLYARIRGGLVERANGNRSAPLQPRSRPWRPTSSTRRSRPGSTSRPNPGTGNPVIVFRSFAAPDDHLYHYARWDGSAWQPRHHVRRRSFRGACPQDYYSGGLTLDHEDSSRVYLSRQVGTAWQVEVWTTANGAPADLAAGERALDRERARPVSPRGWRLGGDLSTIWMRGAYPNYEEYATDIAVLDDSANARPWRTRSPRSETVPPRCSCASTARSPRTRMAELRAGSGTSAMGPPEPART